MKITEAPPTGQRKILTVKRKSQNLKEHREGFESANNASGFKPEEKTTNWMEDFVLELVQTKWHDYEDLHKSVNLRTRSARNVFGKGIKFSFLQNAVGVAFGYKSWNEMRDQRGSALIQNLNYGANPGDVLVAMRDYGSERIEHFKFERVMLYWRMQKHIHRSSDHISPAYFEDHMRAMIKLLAGEEEVSKKDYIFIMHRDGKNFKLYCRKMWKHEATETCVMEIEHGKTRAFGKVIRKTLLPGDNDEIFGFFDPNKKLEFDSQEGNDNEPE